MRESSAQSEVAAVRRAVRLVRARFESEEAFDRAETELHRELDSLGEQERVDAIVDLIVAQTRIACIAIAAGSACTEGVLSDDELLEQVEQAAMISTIACEPDGPG